MRDSSHLDAREDLKQNIYFMQPNRPLQTLTC